MDVDKLLVKDRYGKDLLSRYEDSQNEKASADADADDADAVDDVDPMLEQAQEAFEKLSVDQIDRYYRALKVFFIPKTAETEETFEFEDESV
jgi:hypothetical protein